MDKFTWLKGELIFIDEMKFAGLGAIELQLYQDRVHKNDGCRKLRKLKFKMPSRGLKISYKVPFYVDKLSWSAVS